MSDVDWEAHVEDYSFEKDQRTFHIARRSKSTWVVMPEFRFVLDPKLIEFVYEPFPSNRNKEFIHDTRFKSKEKAYAQLERYWGTHERKGPGWARTADAPPLSPGEEEGP
jgi:hypothetical protein